MICKAFKVLNPFKNGHLLKWDSQETVEDEYKNVSLKWIQASLCKADVMKPI